MLIETGKELLWDGTGRSGGECGELRGGEEAVSLLGVSCSRNY
jgi:hypothetical protein